MAAVSAFTVSSVSAPTLEQGWPTGVQDDLDTTIPGTGIALGGDGTSGYPRIRVPGVYEGPNPLPVPDDARPIPTGTGVGPKGARYGFYAVVPYASPEFTSPDTVMVDLSEPAVPITTLSGIAQASATYDPNTGRMFVVGNTAAGRALWMSGWRCRRPWWNTLSKPAPFIGALNGDRESQIVAVRGAGFLLVGAADYGPIVCAAASSAAGLRAARACVVIDHTGFPDGMYPYGPTVLAAQSVGGDVDVRIRVSTYGSGRYDPRTYIVGFVLRRS